MSGWDGIALGEPSTGRRGAPALPPVGAPEPEPYAAWLARRRGPGGGDARRATPLRVVMRFSGSGAIAHFQSEWRTLLNVPALQRNVRDALLEPFAARYAAQHPELDGHGVCAAMFRARPSSRSTRASCS